jgi:1,2-diacylglycerol 3-alpha-glucosyltransferase
LCSGRPLPSPPEVILSRGSVDFPLVPLRRMTMSSKLAICMISDDFLPAATGVGMHTQLLGRELARRGHRVSVITSRRAGEPPVESWNDVTVYRSFTVKLYGFYQALPSKRTIRAILAREHPDVIHHHYLGFMMKRVCGVAEALALPQVFTYHFSAEVLTQPLLMRPFRGLIRRQILDYGNRCDLVVAPSSNLARQIAGDGIRTPVRHITNPVVIEEREDVAPAARAAHFTVLFAGRLGPEKNLPYLLRALAQLARSVPEFTLWIAGRGPELGSLQQLSGQLGIASHVEFLGFLDHPTLASYYAACDVFVLPSLEEAQPLVVMEAMWFGKPVIVTDAIVAADELVENGVNGYIVDANLPENLAARLATLADDPALRARMGDASRQRAEAYRPEHVVAALELAYRDVLAQRGHD